MMAILLMLGMATQAGVSGIRAEGAATPVVDPATEVPPVATGTEVPPDNLSAFCAHDDAYTTNSGTTLTVPAPGIFANDPGTYDLVTVGPVAHGSVKVNPDGGFSYVPASGFVGTDAFVYELTCSDGVHRYATVTISVLGDDPTPVPTPGCSPQNDVYSTAKNKTLTVPNPGIFGNDVYGVGIIDHSVIAVGYGSHGFFNLYPDGGFVYTPNTGFIGTETLTYTVLCSKASGPAFTQLATVTIQVGLVPTTPTPTPSCSLTDDAYTMNHDSTLTVGKPGVFANDTFPAPFSLAAVGTASHGTASVATDGTLIYVPNPGYSGIDTFTYSVRCGSAGDFHTSTATVSITVKGMTMFAPSSTVSGSDR